MGKMGSFLVPVLLLADLVLFCVLNACGVRLADAYPARFAFGADTSKYTVRGVDVSEYQGEIDWNVLAGQDLDFAYIKATKGSGYKDKKFKINWENAAKTDLEIGAYHLFAFDEPAQEQAENFIGSVPDAYGLPPAVDVELYGKDRDDPPDPEKTIPALAEFLEALEKRYCKKPVIYATKKAYQLYVQGHFRDNPLWIRDPDKEPVLPDGRGWTFWQHSNEGEMKGYGGESRFIDLNVFKGTEKEFADFIKYGIRSSLF